MQRETEYTQKVTLLVSAVESGAENLVAASLRILDSTVTSILSKTMSE